MKKSKTSISKDAADKPASQDFLIVGVGASAGGIQALKTFFENVPVDSGAAYVVILHLSPDHDSQLAKVLQTVALIPVTQVTEKVRVVPNHVYVVPPDRSLSMADEHIIVSPIQTVEERRAPVDIFFRTLAESHGERNVAVILSGTGADGSMGIKRVKENGGAAFVQNPREAEFSEMPRNSIATDLIDLILNVGEIPAQIVAYRKNSGKIEIPPDGENKPKAEKQPKPPHEQALNNIFTQLRVRTGHDFTNYKRATILRRIERRINVRGLPDIMTYAAYLRENPDETTALLKDLLISVTNFFRDKETFLYLEKEILPKLFDGKNLDDQIRVWVAGCATGEEAYSLAMFLAEQSLKVDGAPTIQVFATDIDKAAVAKAREGFYTLSDAADVSPERLQRFFTEEANGYRIRRELRDLILFAHHDILKDPPFSRLDLVTCRNMLIYLNTSAQARVMETFHFSLNAGGYLFLGNSETVDGASGLYATVSRDHHIYQSRQVAQRINYPLPESYRQLARFVEPNYSEIPTENTAPINARPLERISYAGLHQQLLEEYTPSVVINEEHDIVHMSESSLRFMQMSGGEPTQNLLKLIRSDLRIELRTALYQAAQRQTNVEVTNVKLKSEELEESVNISVRPVMRQSDTARGFILVLFESVKESRDGDETVYRSDEPVARQLEEQLVRSKLQLRSSAEQYEVQAEEFKASNEELQALNEELRSSAEELETGKEELQSLNEELGTVNQELKIKVEEVSQTSNYLNNLINSTDIGTIFLDRLLRVDLFTPAAARIFNLIAADIGRPLADIAHQLENGDLLDDVRLVLDRLQTVEREVRTVDGRDFVMRIQPYRTTDDKINGVVVTFYDITERKRAEVTKSFLASIVESSKESMLTINFDRVITSWNRAAETLYGYTAAEVIGKQYTMLTLPEDLKLVLKKIDRIEHSKQVETFDTVRKNKDGREMVLEIVLSPVKDDAGAVIGVSTIARDVTERRIAEEILRRSEDRQSYLLKLADALRPLTDPLEIQATACRVLGEHLGSDRVYYVEIHEESREYIVIQNWNQPGIPSHARRYPLDDWKMPWLTNGKTWVVTDVDSDPAMPDDQRAQYRENDIGALVVVPLIKDGSLAATFVANNRTARPWTPHEVALVEETAERTWAAVTRAHTEEALIRSEEKYRTLFDSIDEGVSTIEVIFDENERAVDFRYLENNSSFARLTGLPSDAEGKRWLELTPALEPLISERFERIIKTGEPERFEQMISELNDTWFEMYISRIGGHGSRTLVSVYNNITDRKRREANLAFLAETSADFAPLFTAEEIMERVGSRLAAHLNLSRCIFSIVDEEADHMECLYAWRRDDSLPDLFGAHRISTFLSEEGRRHYAAGKLTVIGDMKKNPLLNPSMLEMTDELGLGSAVDAPYLKDGRWRFLLTAVRAEAGEWRTDEVELVRELSERICIRIDRARAEEAMRVAEERYLALINSLEQGFCTLEVRFDERNKAVDYRFVEISPSFERQTGIKNAEGRWMREIAPDHDEHWFETYGRIALTGEPERFENYSTPLKRWWSVYAFRIEEPESRRVAVLFFDITDRKRAEEASRQSEERLRLLVESASDYAILTMTPDAVIDTWNAGAEKVFGWTESEAVGQSGEIIFTPEDRAAGVLKQEIQTALANGRAPDERFHLRKDGSRFSVSGVMTLLKDTEGRVQGFVKIARDMTEQIAAEKALHEREMLQRLVAAQEDERKRIARDLHDELGQQLTVLRMKLDAARKLCEDEAVCDRIDDIQLIAKSIDNGVDFLAWELRPAALDDLGLVAALANYVKQWSHHSGVAAELLASSLKRTRFAPQIETNLYRIVQEALNNTHKHAAAANVEVMLERRGSSLVLIIADDGKGFNPPGKRRQPKGMGIVGMRERAALIGGTLEIESAPRAGTSIFVRLPAASIKKMNSNSNE